MIAVRSILERSANLRAECSVSGCDEVATASRSLGWNEPIRKDFWKTLRAELEDKGWFLAVSDECALCPAHAPASAVAEDDSEDEPTGATTADAPDCGQPETFHA